MLELLFTLFVFRQTSVYPHEVVYDTRQHMTYNDCALIVHEISERFDPNIVYSACMPEQKEEQH